MNKKEVLHSAWKTPFSADAQYCIHKKDAGQKQPWNNPFIPVHQRRKRGHSVNRGKNFRWGML
jgi:hypothetical protein